MLSWFVKLKYKSEKEQQAARILVLLMLSACFAYLVTLILSLAFGDRYGTGISLLSILLMAGPIWLLYQRHLNKSLWIFMFCSITSMNLFATFGQGYRDVSIFAIPLILVFASMALGREALKIAFGLVLASLAWLVFGQKWGWFVPQPILGTYTPDFIVLTVLLLVWAFVIDLLTTTLRESLDKAQKENMRRQLTEQALQESEARYRELLDNTDTGFVVIDDKGMVRVANEPYCKLVGAKKPEEVLGRSVIEWTAPEEREKNTRAVARCVQQGFISDFETVYQQPNGTRVNVLINANSEANADGTINLVSFCRNITDRKRAEEEHGKYELELQKSQKLESLGVLAGGIAHDFNNLLTIIYGNLQLVMMDPGSKDAAECLANSMNTMNRAKAITSQLLTFAKGGVPMKKVARLAPFLQDTVKFALSGSACLPDFNIAEGLWNLEYDENQMGQVFDNIVINACQAMPNGGKISITAKNAALQARQHPSLAAGNYVKISFTDSGVGMPSEVMRQIFDPYFSTKGKGRGLGLTSAYSIVKNHGGCIDPESTHGKGSVLHVYLPASNKPLSEDAAVPVFKIKKTGKILIMDDEADLVKVLGKILISLGCAPIGAPGGREALELMAKPEQQKEPFMAAILDLTIPNGMGGKDTVKEMKKLAPNLPVFVSSGYSDDPVMADPAKYGFSGRLNKPFEAGEIIELLNNFAG